VITGRRRGASEEQEVVRFIDDGYRIYATWVSGGPLDPKPGQCLHVATYKYCDMPTLSSLFIDTFMKSPAQWELDNALMIMNDLRVGFCQGKEDDVRVIKANALLSKYSGGGS
jgi:hypothetical protein